MGDMGIRFVAAFNDIEDHFRRSLAAEEYVDFGTMARRYADKYHLPMAHRDALSAYASLRNAITHSRYYNGQPIADPVLDVVTGIERLRDFIRRPPTALSAIPRQTVRITRPEDPLSSALRWVREYDYSQFPVYDRGRYSGLLTTNTVARWLADQLGDIGLAEEVPVAQVLRFAEPQDQAKLVARSITVLEAMFALQHGAPRGEPVPALVVTNEARIHEDPLAIITTDDLPSLSKAVDIL